jgi:hypothetical protein
MNETALAYALEVGNPDVRATLSWLAANGFDLTVARGGRHESFGNIQLVFRGAATVEILRDRLQWDVRVGPADGTRLWALSVLTAARDGRVWEYPQLADDEMPPQLPRGLTWHDELPSVIRWLQEPDSAQRVEATDPAARAVMRRRLGC